jgi:predicted glycoside hydrolase/deacetylase ChbG (UPF0249 family)
VRYLIVNADDFGFTRDVNRGIVRAHREGILTATTLMANGAAFDDAVALAQEHPTLDIGAHLQMVQGESMSQPGRALPETIPQLLLSLGAWDIEGELRAQIERMLAAGICLTHLDTHKHTHILPPVLDAVARLSREYAIPFIRRPFDLPLDPRPASLKTRLAGRLMPGMKPHFARVLQAHNARATDHFAGFLWTGNYSADDLLALFANLPPGSTEFMCHPGELGPEILAARTRLKHSRAAELTALTDPRLKPALEAEAIALTSYRDLAG